MDLELIPEHSEATSGVNLPFTLINGGSGTISFGLAYVLEREEDGVWVGCNVERAWPALLISLKPGGRHEGTAVIAEDAPPGRYRVSKRVTTENREATVSFEFDVAHR